MNKLIVRHAADGSEVLDLGDESLAEWIDHSLDGDDADPARWRKVAPPPPDAPRAL